jgi:hypothetical protein
MRDMPRDQDSVIRAGNQTISELNIDLKVIKG